MKYFFGYGYALQESDPELAEILRTLLGREYEFTKNAKFPDFKRKFTEIEAERAELKAKVTELLKQNVKEIRGVMPRMPKLESENQQFIELQFGCKSDIHDILGRQGNGCFFSWIKCIRKRLVIRCQLYVLSQNPFSTTSKSFHCEADLFIINAKHTLPE
ncbi:hypothetical protein RhiirA1_456765 [Rhizophagus irregularis]|uniref:Uncharacterized protein n=1 Tax=Rhizophagus irregularis TaxID=588596 RepID=A0A2I1F225_9GLOM|nr:hypothetical protein RhiirA1_456765 [Rhizophagus irregularis]PKY28430.1 hypothetical protein RhiirB3_444601 [Rhizophagus irregularis]